MTGTRKRIADLLTLILIGGLLAAVYLLPPDTSLAEIRRTGLLRVCIPPAYPPLVTGNPDAPGFDIELMDAIGERLGLRVAYNVNAAIGTDFNPRNWRVTRAQCQVIAGGIVATNLTRSFLDTSPPHLETGWVIVADDAALPLDGLAVGVYVGLSGRDRIALGRFLREEGAEIAIVQTRADLVAGLRSGAFDAAITDAFVGADIAAGDDGWAVAWLSPDERDPIAFGLWKGDLTLKRAIVAAIDDLTADGTIDRLRQQYRIGEIEAVYTPAESD